MLHLTHECEERERKGACKVLNFYTCFFAYNIVKIDAFLIEGGNTMSGDTDIGSYKGLDTNFKITNRPKTTTKIFRYIRG